MRTYKVKKKEHYVYDLESELPGGITIALDWKNARVGDWVKADDDAYIQILKRKKIGKTDTVQTCIGTYSVNGTMDTSERKDRYSLNGKTSNASVKQRKVPTYKEKLFAKKVMFDGKKAVDAYMEVYDANSRNYAKQRAALILKTKRMDTYMNQDLRDTFGKKGVDLDYLIERAKDKCDNSKNDSDQLNALKMLWDAWGVVEKQKVTEVKGIFQGFEPKHLKEVKRPELAEHQSLGDETV